LVVTDRLAPRELLADLDPSVEVIDVAKVPAAGSPPTRRSTGSSSTGLAAA
jgi:siroheme synthase